MRPHRPWAGRFPESPLPHPGLMGLLGWVKSSSSPPSPTAPRAFGKEGSGFYRIDFPPLHRFSSPRSPTTPQALGGKESRIRVWLPFSHKTAKLGREEELHAALPLCPGPTIPWTLGRARVICRITFALPRAHGALIFLIFFKCSYFSNCF